MKRQIPSLPSALAFVLMIFAVSAISVQAEETRDLILAVSWEPAFCEGHSAKKECRKLNAGLLPEPAQQLSLHGLWPQPNGTFYCDVPETIQKLDKENRWSQLPEPQLDADTAGRLTTAMPGTASFLHRHEWIKHGTCYSDTDNTEAHNSDTYFDHALLLLDAINRSDVGQFFSSKVNKSVSSVQIRKAFDTAFGAEAGDRVRIECTTDNRRILIEELQISLHGAITETADIGALINAGSVLNQGCAGGIIDPSGLQ